MGEFKVPRFQDLFFSLVVGSQKYNEQVFINSQRRYLLKIPMLTSKKSHFSIGA